MKLTDLVVTVVTRPDMVAVTVTTLRMELAPGESLAEQSEVQ